MPTFLATHSRASSSPSNNKRPVVHEQKHGEAKLTRGDPSPFSAYAKLGLLAVCALSIGLFILLGSIALLWFLWIGNGQNQQWRAIAARNWITRVIALTSLAIRQSVSFQASAATAMIACLALEYMIVPLLSLASVSTTRHANAGPYTLFWWLWKGFSYNPSRWKTFHWPLLIALLTCTSMLIQLTSFALLSDLDLVFVQASNHTKAMSTHFKYNSKGEIPVITHGSTWSQPVQSYVSFAEYHEAPADSLPDGIVDTGLTLRAFLPVADEESRSMVANWDGIATVLDARTLCMSPKLASPRLHIGDDTLALETGYAFEFDTDLSKLGLVRPHGEPEVRSCATDLTLDDGSCSQKVTCLLPLAPASAWHTDIYSLAKAETSQWRLVVCQPWPTNSPLFVLQSQFRSPGNVTRPRDAVTDYSFGNAYIMVNVSSGSKADWARAIPGEDSDNPLFVGPGTPPLGYGHHGQNNEWYDLIYSKNANLNLSVSVCYTAFDTADLHVQLESRNNHSDTTPSWNAQKHAFDYSQVRAQFGQELDGKITYSHEYSARNIMKLQNRGSWIPDPKRGDYVVPANRITETSWITDYANMAGSFQSNGFRYYTDETPQNRFLWQAFDEVEWPGEVTATSADPGMIGLIQEILTTGGSIAFTMQSIVTSLTELAYYQQLQQLNGQSDVTSSSYVQASAPVRKRGILAVTIVLGVHVMVVFAIILPAFLTLTTISALGNAWQAVAQIIDPKIGPILDRASLATDKEAEAEMKIPTGKKGKLKNRELVGLSSTDGVSVQVVSASNRSDVEGGSEPAVTIVDEHGNEREDQGWEHDNLLRQRAGGGYNRAAFS